MSQIIQIAQIWHLRIDIYIYLLSLCHILLHAVTKCTSSSTTLQTIHNISVTWVIGFACLQWQLSNFIIIQCTEITGKWYFHLLQKEIQMTMHGENLWQLFMTMRTVSHCSWALISTGITKRILIKHAKKQRNFNFNFFNFKRLYLTQIYMSITTKYLL